MQENDAVYEFGTRIRYSEVGHGGCMTLPALINLFQDCSIFHSEAVGYGPARLKCEHKAWVLTHWQLVVDRYPTVGERAEQTPRLPSHKALSSEHAPLTGRHAPPHILSQCCAT